MWLVLLPLHIIFFLLTEEFGVASREQALQDRITELEASYVRLEADHRRITAENADLHEIVDYFVREAGESLV